MGEPLITVCVPTLGRATYIEQTFQSLKYQRLKDFELLILYNGNDPATIQKLESFAGAFPNARLLADARPLSMFQNFNRGLREAKGKYVTFFHDDDVYEPAFLETTTSILEGFPGAAFAGSNYFIIDESNRITGLRTLVKRTRIQPGEAFIRELVRRGRSAVPTPGIVFRKTAFDEPGFDEGLSMHFGDFVMYLRIAEQHDVALIERPLLRLRLHDDNASNMPISIAAPMQYQMVNAYIDEFEQRHPDRSKLARHLRRSARTALTRGLFWGWISARDDNEALKCLQLLGEHRTARLLAALLSFVSALGYRPHRRKTLAIMVRRLGRSFG